MATEKRLIDANEVERKLEIAISSWWRDCNSNAPVIARAMTDALQRVKYAPTVDAVEVVRCKDCLYRSQYSDENGMYHCGGIDTTKDHALTVVSPDFFCAHGERRVHETDIV